MSGSRLHLVMLALGLVLGGGSLGCGAAAQLALKKPIVDQCSSKGLKGCDDLADAALAYANGEKAQAEPKLRAVAAANSPEQVKQLAVALKPLAESAGGDTGEALKGVIAILTGETPASASGAVARADAPSAKSADRSVATAKSPAGLSPEHAPSRGGEVNFVSGTVPAGLDETALDCHAGVMTNGATKCGRVHVINGPFVVTNLYASGGCVDDLFVLTGSADRPRWIVWNPAGTALNYQGNLELNDGQPLVVGARTTKNPALSTDIRCSVTWSGYRRATRATYPALDSGI